MSDYVRKRTKAASKLKSFRVFEKKRHYDIKRLFIIYKFSLYYVVKYFKI